MTARPTALTTEFATFRERRDRSVYVAQRFSGYLGEAVLDVGCYEAPLRALIGRERYLGVDIAGSPDLVIDLDTPHSLPFGDNTFASVLCIEVLEHLDHLHHVFDELVRVSSRHVIVSLPNCWRDARRPIERGKGAFAHYGLPPERPLDRHKWFFGYAEGRDFLLAAAARHGLEVLEIFGTEQHRNVLLRAWRRLRYPGVRYHNRYVQTVWAVMRKPASRG